jgi:hypothetical protein
LHLPLTLLVLTLGGLQIASAQTPDYSGPDGAMRSCNDTLGYVGCDNMLHPHQPAQAPAIWGAIAVSDSTLVSGTSWEYQNPQDAQAQAVRQCSLAMNAMRDCKVIGNAFANACVALATSPNEHAWGYSGTYNSLAQASQSALGQCRSSGSRSCAITVKFCSPGQASTPADQYAAIAVADSNVKISGISWRASSKSEANSVALEECRKQGGTDCRLQMWASNACLALATSEDGKWGTNWNTNRALAQNGAIQQCRSVNGQRCVIQQSACTNDR